MNLSTRLEFSNLTRALFLLAALAGACPAMASESLPNVDGLATAGVVLDRYHTYPIRGPTRIGLTTGRNPITVGITGNINNGEDGVPLDEHMVPGSKRVLVQVAWRQVCQGAGGGVSDLGISSGSA